MKYFQRRKNDAFTLAEVLITLAIIGVVVALTIPIMQKKYSRVYLETTVEKGIFGTGSSL